MLAKRIIIENFVIHLQKINSYIFMLREKVFLYYL
jgi:hypothetical protein